MEFTLRKPDYRIKEGTYTLKVLNVTANEVNHRVMVTYQTEKGRRINEFFFLTKNDGTPNELSETFLTKLVQAALNNYDVDNVKLEDIIGKYIEADLSNREYEVNGEKKQGINVYNKRPTNETFEDKQEKSSIDVNDLLA